MKYFSLSTADAISHWQSAVHDRLRNGTGRSAVEYLAEALLANGHSRPTRGALEDELIVPTRSSTADSLRSLFVQFGARTLDSDQSGPPPSELKALAAYHRQFEATGALYEYTASGERRVCDSLLAYAFLGWCDLLCSKRAAADQLYFLNGALKARDLLVKLYLRVAPEDALIAAVFVTRCDTTLQEFYDSRGFRLPAER